MATEFSTEFDGTDGAAANLASENPSNLTVNQFTNRTAPNGWFYETGSKVSGTASIVTTNPSGSTSVWTYSHAEVGLHYYDQCYKVTTLPAAEIIIGQIRLVGVNKAQITLTPAGAVRIKNGTTQVDSTADGFISANTWFRWKWGIGVTPGTPSTNQELRLYTDASPANLLGTSPDDTLIGTYNGGDWDQYRLGIMSGQALEVWCDRFVVDGATWPSSGGSGNTAPTADAGPDQSSVIGGTVVSLDGTGSSDPDGTITDYAWTQTGGTTVALSDDTDPEPTFTAPTTAGSATFQLRVTDDDGAQSSPDTVVITWSNQATLPTSDFYELFDEGSDETTLTNANTDFDTVSGGWTKEVPGLGTAFASAKVTMAGANKLFVHELGSLISSIYCDCMYQIEDLSVGPWYLMRATDAGTVRAAVRVNTDGSVQLRNGATAVGTATTHLVTEGQPFRIAWHPNNGSVQEAKLFTGANLYGTSPVSGATTSGTMTNGTFDEVEFGGCQPAVASGLLTLAIPQVDASAYPTPYGGPTGVASQLYMMVDGVWEDALIDVL